MSTAIQALSYAENLGDDAVTFISAWLVGDKIIEEAWPHFEAFCEENPDQEIVCHSPVLATPGLNANLTIALIAKIEVINGKSIIYLNTAYDYYVAGTPDRPYMLSRLKIERDQYPIWPFAKKTENNKEELERVRETFK